MLREEPRPARGTVQSSRGGYHTRVITTGVAPSLHISYKHTDIKHYFKEQHAPRTETTINVGRKLDAYSRGAMTYDLRRLRLHRLIQRVPHAHRYLVTLDGFQIASFDNTLYHHVLRPGWATLEQPAIRTPAPLDTAIRHLANVTRALFQHIQPEPDRTTAAA